MRIALVTDAWFPQVNGVVMTLSNVSLELERDRHDMLVINPSLFRTVRRPRYPEIRLSMLPGRALRQMLSEFRPQAIHIATEGPLGLAARGHCNRARLPFTTSYRTQFAHYLRLYFHVPRACTYAAIRWFHSAARRTLVPTPSVGRELESRGFRNVVTWTRGVDTDLFKPRQGAVPPATPELLDDIRGSSSSISRFHESSLGCVRALCIEE